MGKRKNDKLETMYQNIDLKFKDASEEEIREEIARGNLQIEENNNEIEKLKETIKTKQQLIEALEGKDESETSPRIQKAIEDASKELEEAQNKLKDYEDLEIILEPGRAIAANAGILVAKVQYLKSNESRNFAITDTGMNDMIRPALYEAYMNIIEIDRTLGREKAIYDVVGPV